MTGVVHLIGRYEPHSSGYAMTACNEGTRRWTTSNAKVSCHRCIKTHAYLEGEHDGT